jgi:dihydrofolate reductase
MSKLILDVSVSLDGFSAGPNPRPEEPMGDGGEGLHEWAFAAEGPEGEIDSGVRKELDAMVGSTIVGRRTFELGTAPWGGTPWPNMASFVVTHSPREDLLADNGGTFAFDGLESAARRAKEAAGDKDVVVLGAELARSLLKAGLLDVVWIHLVPRLMGSGTRLFDGVPAELIPEGKPLAGAATHLRYRVAK